MTPKERLVATIDGGRGDRLAVTTHHVMPYFLDKYLGGISSTEFFERFGLDPITWEIPHRPGEEGDYFHPQQDDPDFLQNRMISNDDWRIEWETIEGQKFPTTRYRIVTPKGTLTTELQSNNTTSWVSEHLIKKKSDIDLIGEFATAPYCDVELLNQAADTFGQRGLVRGHICCFDLFGQPGCWQDAACLIGTEDLIMATYDDPGWVHELLKILQRRKLVYAKSLKGAKYDLLELGGGDASSTVISPKIFEEFVAPYDSEIIRVAHEAGQRIVYHTCGGMMPLLEMIAEMEPDAMETFTPAAMGGDVDLAEARERLPKDMCMIGGFDQFHFFTGCTEEQTRAEVRRCFEAAGKNGAYILCPSDHFFDVELNLLEAFADEARLCCYND